jgi:hypothetical protein
MDGNRDLRGLDWKIGECFEIVSRDPRTSHLSRNQKTEIALKMTRNYKERIYLEEHERRTQDKARAVMSAFPGMGASSGYVSPETGKTMTHEDMIRERLDIRRNFGSRARASRRVAAA